MNPGIIFPDKIKYNQKIEVDLRNNNVINFFKNFNLPIRLVGNAINPAVIYNESIALSVAFKGNDLILKQDQVKGSGEIASFNIINPKSCNEETITDFVQNGMHKTIYKIYVECNCVPTNKLYLGKYKHNDKLISPSFTAEIENSAVFFSKKSLDFIYNKLIDNHYNVKTE